MAYTEIQICWYNFCINKLICNYPSNGSSDNTFEICICNSDIWTQGVSYYTSPITPRKKTVWKTEKVQQIKSIVVFIGSCFDALYGGHTKHCLVRLYPIPLQCYVYEFGLYNTSLRLSNLQQLIFDMFLCFFSRVSA